MELIEINQEFSFDKEIPLLNVFGDKAEEYSSVLSVNWQGSLIPGRANVTPVVTENKRYEEIQLIQIRIVDRSSIFSIAKTAFRTIAYPCVVEFVNNDAVIIGVSNFECGAKDKDRNVNVRLVLSHWIRKDFMSVEAQSMIQKINEAIKEGGSIDVVLMNIRHAIINYKLSGTSKSHVERIIEYLVGSNSADIEKKIANICVPYKYYPPNFSKNRYKKKTGKGYRLIHDYEELWYCFMTCETTHRAIEKQRYSNIEELIARADEYYMRNEETCGHYW